MMEITLSISGINISATRPPYDRPCPDALADDVHGIRDVAWYIRHIQTGPFLPVLFAPILSFFAYASAGRSGNGSLE